MTPATRLRIRLPTGPYISVPDADASVAKVAELGGAVVMPPEDTPYGRLAVCTDSTGSTFSIIQPPAA